MTSETRGYGSHGNVNKLERWKVFYWLLAGMKRTLGSSVEFYSVSENDCEEPVKSLCQIFKAYFQTKSVQRLSMSMLLISLTGVLVHYIPDQWLVITDELSRRPANASCVSTNKYPLINLIFAKDLIQAICSTVSVICLLMIMIYLTPVYNRFIYVCYQQMVIGLSVIGIISSLLIFVTLLAILDKMRHQLGEDFCAYNGELLCPLLIKQVYSQKCSISVLATLLCLVTTIAFFASVLTRLETPESTS